ncbi:hypothetical protein RhiJN_22156 [Ceratobasidium sp. AG-Ba]|nr:hypothetical protein RhiJN_22156 [Ceratobasidium sp. AG-Ba]
MERLQKRAKHWLKPAAGDIENARGFTPSTSPATSPFAGDPLSGFMFVPRAEAAQWVDLPVGGDWAFHAATPKNNSAATLGYLHHFGHRLTTAVNIFAHDLNEVLKDFKKLPKYDEYTEIVVVGLKKPGIRESLLASEDQKDDPRNWELCFIDHFNRRVMTQDEFEKDPSEAVYAEKAGTMTSPERPYRNWMDSVTSDNSHYYRPSPNEKRQCLGRKIAQQIVWDYQTTHVVKDMDIEGSFSISDCSSLLSALQKKRVSDKQCQKMIKAVIQRFLSVPVADDRPKISQNFDPEAKSERVGALGFWGMIVYFLIWTGPMLHVPFSYFRRLRMLANRADNGDYVPDLWQAFINGLLKEWNDLNIVSTRNRRANVAFLALPGTSGSDAPDDKSPGIAEASRAAGIISMFMTMSGLLTSLCLIWLHSPLSTTGTSDAYKYIIGRRYKPGVPIKHPTSHNSFIQLAGMATFLAMPLVLLVWSVLAFVVSAMTWIFLFSEVSTQITTVVICGTTLLGPILTILVFRGPTMAGDGLFVKTLRGRTASGSS